MSIKLIGTKKPDPWNQEIWQNRRLLLAAESCLPFSLSPANTTGHIDSG